jgi:carbonic anhydrase/acetyltransferase-like protein (isoleucine patch superfamily)
VVHAEPDTIAILEEDVLIGHGAIVPGPCLIKHNAMVGMGAIISSGGELGEESLLAAGSILPPGKIIPARKVAMGNPAQVVRDIMTIMWFIIRWLSNCIRIWQLVVWKA